MTDGPKPQILVVDDEPALRESLGMLLASVGYDVDTASNGVSAVSQMNRTVPDLIVTDLNMPEMSGIELITHVRGRYPAVLIVAMSGDYHDEAVPASIMADRYYPKGQDPHKLLAVIASLIEGQTGRGICGNRSDSYNEEGNYARDRFDRYSGVASCWRASDVESQSLLGLSSQRRTGFVTGRRFGLALVWPDLVAPGVHFFKKLTS